jgi:hypothetical protein
VLPTTATSIALVTDVPNNSIPIGNTIFSVQKNWSRNLVKTLPIHTRRRKKSPTILNILRVPSEY